MNWLDLVFIALLAVSGVAGARLGLFWAALAFGGLLISWYFAGNISGAFSLVLPHYTESATAQAVAHVLTFAALYVIVMYALGRMLAILKAFLSTVTLGLANVLDRAGGFVLGLVIGLAIIGSLILVGARLTYQVDFSEIDLNVPGAVEERVRQGETVQEGLRDLLGESAIAREIVRAGAALPGDALGLAPMELGDALHLLDQSLD